MKTIHNSKSQKTTILEADDRGAITQHQVQDAANILDFTKAKRNDGTNGWSKSRNQRYLGTMPMLEYQRQMDIARGWYEGCTNDDWVKNDIDYIVLERNCRRWLEDNKDFLGVDKI